jgi:hypothetical protein
MEGHFSIGQSPQQDVAPMEEEEEEEVKIAWKKCDIKKYIAFLSVQFLDN